MLRAQTASFRVALGIHVLCSTAYPEVPVKDGRARPPEHLCDLRRMQLKDFEQPEQSRDQNDIWFVREDGANVTSLLTAARDAVLTEAMWWFDRFDRLEPILEYVTHTPDNLSGTWGLGTIGSPLRQQLEDEISAEIATGRAG